MEEEIRHEVAADIGFFVEDEMPSFVTVIPWGELIGPRKSVGSWYHGWPDTDPPRERAVTEAIMATRAWSPPPPPVPPLSKPAPPKDHQYIVHSYVMEEEWICVITCGRCAISVRTRIDPDDIRSHEAIDALLTTRTPVNISCRRYIEAGMVRTSSPDVVPDLVFQELGSGKVLK